MVHARGAGHRPGQPCDGPTRIGGGQLPPEPLAGESTMISHSAGSGSFQERGTVLRIWDKSGSEVLPARMRPAMPKQERNRDRAAGRPDTAADRGPARARPSQALQGRRGDRPQPAGHQPPAQEIRAIVPHERNDRDLRDWKMRADLRLRLGRTSAGASSGQQIEGAGMSGSNDSKVTTVEGGDCRDLEALGGGDH